MRKTKLFNNEKGISLVSLAVVIIVMVILTGIVLSYAIGDNGLFSFIGSTKDTTDVATEKDQLSTAIKDAKALDYMQGGSGGLTKEGLQEALDDLVGEGKTKVTTTNAAEKDTGSSKGMDIVFILDISGSMNYDLNEDSYDCTASETRAAALVTALNSACDIIAQNSNNRLAIVTYSSDVDTNRNLAKVEIDATGNYFSYTKKNNSSQGTLTMLGKNITVTGGTYTQAGIFTAYEVLNSRQDKDNTPVIMLFTDGQPTYGYRSYTSIGNSNKGNGSSENADVGYYTVLTGRYVREQIWGDDTPYFYTVGMGINEASSSDLFAVTVLNPSAENIAKCGQQTGYNSVCKSMYTKMQNQTAYTDLQYVNRAFLDGVVDGNVLKSLVTDILNSVIYAEGIQVWFQGEDGSDTGRIYIVNPDGTVSDDYVIGEKPKDEENTTSN